MEREVRIMFVQIVLGPNGGLYALDAAGYIYWNADPMGGKWRRLESPRQKLAPVPMPSRGTDRRVR